MDEPDADSPPLPRDAHAPPAIVKGGCIVALVAAVLGPLLLYVGSFAFILLDGWYGWGIVSSLDGRTTGFLITLFWPLIWLGQLAGGLPK